MKLLRWLGNIWICLPILGQLHLAHRKDYSEAFKEIMMSLLISTAPIWAGALVILAQNYNSNGYSYIKCILSIINNGELFIYAASTVAPVIYIVTKERQGAQGFPGRYSFIGFAIVCSILATLIFTMQRLSPASFPTPMIISSLWLFGVAVLAVFLALVFNHMLMPNPANLMRESERNYIDRLRRHRP